MATEFIPEIMAGAAYVAGLVPEWHAQRKAAVEQQPVADALAKTAPYVQESETGKYHRWFNTVQRRGISVIAGLAAAGGAFAGLAIEQANPHQSELPLIEIGVDHSGATGLTIGKNPPEINAINSLAMGLGSVHGIDAEAVVSGSGMTYETPLADLSQDQPRGQSKMSNVTLSAIGNIANALASSTQHGTRRNAAVFMITNGNNIGDPQTVTNEADLTKAKQYIPIYVVNVEDESDATTTADLKKIATNTGGHYWGIKQARTNEVAKEVKEAVGSFTVPDHSQNQEVFEAVMAGFCLGLSGVAYKLRRRLPINKGFNKRKI